MNKIKLLIVTIPVLIFISAPTFGETWDKYGSGPLFDAFIDLDTMQISDTGAVFWVKWDLNGKGRSEFAKRTKKKKAPAYLKAKWSVDCGNGRYSGPTASEKSNYLFDKTGAMIEDNPSVNSSYEIIPGTLLEVMHQKVCGIVLTYHQEIAAKNAAEEAAAEAKRKEEREAEDARRAKVKAEKEEQRKAADEARRAELKAKEEARKAERERREAEREQEIAAKKLELQKAREEREAKASEKDREREEMEREREANRTTREIIRRLPVPW